MVVLIVGKKGEGKTKRLLDKVNGEVKNILGNICYLDKSSKHMYELNNRVRLICVPDFSITNEDEFFGFVCGIISQDHDLEQMYFDSFLDISCIKEGDISSTVKKLSAISTQFSVDMILSVSLNEADIPEDIRELATVSM